MNKSYLLALLIFLMNPLQGLTQNKIPIQGEVFEISGQRAFLILPDNYDKDEGIPWVWYAPTLDNLPAVEEKWMFDRFLEKGIAIAGINVGESYGNPEGREHYTKFYQEMVSTKGLSKKACLLARSRGGLMLYNWAAEHPESVACIAGIYPVGNLSSWPGLDHACGAYNMTEDELESKLGKHNPIDRLQPLAEAKVPIFHIHGDQDDVVPLDENSALIKERYEKLGGQMTLEIVEGQGHNMWTGWFESQNLVDFVLTRAKPNKWSEPYRNWSYNPDLVIPPNPDIPGYEKVKMTDVPTIFQIPGDDKWYMSFIGFDGQGYQSFIAESEDLINWENYRLAMGYGPEGGFDYGGVVLGAYLYEDYDIKAPRTLKKKNGKYYSLYGAYPRQGGYELRPGYEGLAQSDDGLNWERAQDEPILSVHQDDCGDWEQSCIYQPWLIEHDEQFYNIYNAANGSIEQMGLAASPNLLDWKRYQNNPVIPHGAEGSFNEKFSSDIKIFRDQDHWIGFFFGVGQGGAHIMAAYSKDLYMWTIDPDPLYKAGGNPSGIDGRYAHKISLVWNPENKTYYMFYCAVDQDGNRGIGLITSKPLTYD